ncbi:MAG: diacylglycerol/lipid kinase family protein [Fimbriimonadales bacterium]
MTSQIAVILNVKAGAGQNRRGEIERAFVDSGLAYRVLEAGDQRTAEEAAAEAINEGIDHLCACGGDGTVAKVVNAVMKSGRRDLLVSIVPMGTANLIAEVLGIPSEIQAAVKALRAGAVREIDVGRIDEHYFVLGMGIGATERFVTQTGDGSKKRLGRLAYVVSLLRQTGAPLYQLQVEVDGKEVSPHHAEASTLANFWGTTHLKLLTDSCADDGKMELLVNERLTRWGLVRLIWYGLWGQLQRDEDVKVYQGASFRIGTEPSLPIQLDGNETDLRTPGNVEVLQRALRVCVFGEGSHNVGPQRRSG